MSDNIKKNSEIIVARRNFTLVVDEKQANDLLGANVRRSRPLFD